MRRFGFQMLEASAGKHSAEVKGFYRRGAVELQTSHASASVEWRGFGTRDLVSLLVSSDNRNLRLFQNELRF